MENIENRPYTMDINKENTMPSAHPVPPSTTMSRKPSYACFFVRFAKKACCGGSFWYKLGIWLFGLNWFVGYGGIAICAALASATSCKGWLVVGGVCYALSWGMLGLGTLLMGVDILFENGVNFNIAPGSRVWVKTAP